MHFELTDDQRQIVDAVRALCPLLRHGSEAQKQRWLPRIASGERRLRAFGVTEPAAGSETTDYACSA